MRKVTLKRNSAEFKAKVALDAIKGELVLAKLSAKHGVQHTTIAVCNTQAIEGMAASFSDNPEAAVACSPAEVDRLHAKIGQLVVERDFLANRLS